MTEWRIPASWIDGLCPIVGCGKRLATGLHYCQRHSWTPGFSEGDPLEEEI